jgi:hypothetical protein
MWLSQRVVVDGGIIYSKQKLNTLAVMLVENHGASRE